MYRIVDGFGKKGIEVLDDENKLIRFYSHPEISLNNKLIISEKLDKDAMPDFEKGEHYRVSQLYYYHQRRKKLAVELGKNPEEIKIKTDLSFKWETEFRFRYYKQYVEGKIKDV